MTTTTTTTASASASASEMPELVQKLREQLLATVTQGQKLTIDAAQSWAQAVAVLPAPALPAIPGVPALPGVRAATRYTVDLAGDLLDAQRDFALQLADVLARDTSR
jgi:hypothetical protein